jgi:hypothetical protein
MKVVLAPSFVAMSRWRSIMMTILVFSESDMPAVSGAIRLAAPLIGS